MRSWKSAIPTGAASPATSDDFGALTLGERAFARRNRRGWNRTQRACVQSPVLEDYLRDHDGVITLAQAGRCGLSPQAVRRRIDSGIWRRCSQGVYFVDDRPFTDAARIRAAVWGYGDGAVASGLAAAWWYECGQHR